MYGGQAGFDFLGFAIRQHRVGKYHTGKDTRGRPLGFKTLIRPSREAIKRHSSTLRAVVDTHRGVRQQELIGLLNPKIRGWSNYYSTVCSKRSFTRVDNVLYAKLWSWARWRHRKKTRRWIAAKYWRVRDGEGWVFRPRCGGASVGRWGS